jgi:hypothetical protein
LEKHELNCPTNPNPASYKAQLKRQNLLMNNSSAPVTGKKVTNVLSRVHVSSSSFIVLCLTITIPFFVDLVLIKHNRRPPPAMPAFMHGVGPSPSFTYGHSLPPTTAYHHQQHPPQQQHQGYGMWAPHQQQLQHQYQQPQHHHQHQQQGYPPWS